jgi:hypothetical protein
MCRKMKSEKGNEGEAWEKEGDEIEGEKTEIWRCRRCTRQRKEKGGRMEKEMKKEQKRAVLSAVILRRAVR